MTVQEKIEKLKRAKTSHSTEELAQMGWARYEEIKQELEANHDGEYVMIEVDSGDYFVGETHDEALAKAQEAYPQKAFYAIRIAHKAVGKL